MKRSILSLFLCLSIFGLFAQDDLLMYNMQGIPQSSYSNPANRFDGRYFIGAPVISSTAIRFSNSVRYSDAVKKRGDSLLLSFSSLLSEMKDRNYMTFSSRIDLASFGFNIDERTQIMVNISENINFRFGYDKKLVEFIYRGNAGISDPSPRFDGSGINASHYREYGVGVSHQLNDQWRFGLRVKYLYGMENIYTEDLDVRITTDPETYALTAESEFKLRTAGFHEVDDESFGDYFFGRGNSGIGFDFGANYKMDEKWSFNASVVDLGFIRWKDYVKSYEGSGKFSYDGIEINEFAGDQDPSSPLANDDTSFDRVLDSLEDELGIVESESAYTSPLISRIYLGANYTIDERSFAGFLIQNEIFERKIRPSFSLSYARKMNEWITLTGAYSVINGSFTNLGLGFSVDPGPVQVFFMSDNILGAFTPQHSRNFHFRFGVNLIFGRASGMKIFGNGTKEKGSRKSAPADEGIETSEGESENE